MAAPPLARPPLPRAPLRPAPSVRLAPRGRLRATAASGGGAAGSVLRTCKNCKQQYDPTANHPSACRYHTAHFGVLEDLRRQIAEPFFMEVITLMSWSIWTAQNNFIFKNEAFSIQGTKNAFIKEFALVIQRAKKKYFPNIVQWLQSQA
ncbi:uncharacterized protein LOC120712204 isoform X1 [Panicum virgatum]|uniref:uncharacterized protein LOC120712204 isoform X1 n=1 Tax=Panicum virgatum TaxID=38727 RepID=UPI0019D622FF|nr:uncharacterized protein LOC120712204 isoform X1 [Panicum virgatum]